MTFPLGADPPITVIGMVVDTLAAVTVIVSAPSAIPV